MNPKNKEVIVIVPIYKNYLDAYEKTSLHFCKQYLDDCNVLVISPYLLAEDKIFLDFIKQEKLDVKYFNDEFFNGITGYNRLMLNLEFYKTFLEYRYMLIYQLDALVFSNDLLAWAKKGYDYIGAPWLPYENALSFDSLGNGGFSLRKTETFVSVLESKSLYFTEEKYYRTTYRSKIRYMIIIRIMNKLIKYNITLNYLKIFLYFYKGYEDNFWAFYAKFFTEQFFLPSIEESLKFSFEVNPTFCFDYNKRNLPFGAHAWSKYNLDFWLNNVDGLKETLSKYEQSPKN